MLVSYSPLPGSHRSVIGCNRCVIAADFWRGERLAWSPLALTRYWLLLCALSTCSPRLLLRVLNWPPDTRDAHCWLPSVLLRANAAGDRRSAVALPTRTATAGLLRRRTSGHAETAGHPIVLFPAGHPVELRFTGSPGCIRSAGLPVSATLYCLPVHHRTAGPGFAVPLCWNPGLTVLPSLTVFTHSAPAMFRFAGPPALLVHYWTPSSSSPSFILLCCAHTGPQLALVGFPHSVRGVSPAGPPSFLSQFHHTASVSASLTRTPVGRYTPHFPFHCCIMQWGCPVL